MVKRKLGKTYIRAWREHRGLSLRRLAARLEVDPGGKQYRSHATLGRVETGKTPYNQQLLEALSVALRCTVTELLVVDPRKPSQVVDLVRRLDDRKRAQAIDYLRFLSTN